MTLPGARKEEGRVLAQGSEAAEREQVAKRPEPALLVPGTGDLAGLLGGGAGDPLEGLQPHPHSPAGLWHPVHSHGGLRWGLWAAPPGPAWAWQARCSERLVGPSDPPATLQVSLFCRQTETRVESSPVAQKWLWGLGRSRCQPSWTSLSPPRHPLTSQTTSE